MPVVNFVQPTRHMKLILTPSTTIGDLKKQFASCFPNLRLEFFNEEHRQGQSSSMNKKLVNDTSLSLISGITAQKYFQFEPTATVAEFEQGLQNEFDLSVQVFRRSGNVWLETIQTDSLTLEKQNAMASESARPIHFNIYTLFL